MNRIKERVKLLFLLLLFNITLLAQENGLHLVGTITGTSEQNRIYGAKGIGDINGDGYDDFIVNFNGIYFGSSELDTNPDFMIKRSLVYPIGDVNNDGYDDLMMKEEDTRYYPAQPVFKILKGGEQLDTIPIFTFRPSIDWDMRFTSNIENIGDLNGDGYKDFIISLYQSWSKPGSVYIFNGGASISNEPAKILTEENPIEGWNIGFGASVIGIGDINNDKYDDILIYKDPHDGDSNKVYLYYGCKDLDTIQSKVFPPDGEWFGIEIRNVGDINRDREDEFMISSTTGTHLYLSEDSVKVIRNTIGYCGTGGDINGDEYDDFLICTGETVISSVHGFFGSSKIDTIEDFRIYAEQPYSQFGINSNSTFVNGLNIAGDINGDGYDDILITAPDFRIDEKEVGKVYIYSYKNISSVENYDKSNTTEIFQVTQNYPNPFNPNTIISYRLSVTSFVTIKIYDILGKQVSLTTGTVKSLGEYNFIFNSNRYNLSSGTYFIEFTAEPLSGSAKIYRKVIKTLLLR